MRVCIAISSRLPLLYLKLLPSYHVNNCCRREETLKLMEENHSLDGKEKAVSLPPPHSVSNLDSEVVESKKRNCLCAPTTHAGSFRCRLHRRPPPSPVLSQHAVKKGLASHKALSPKIKLALHNKLKQGCGKRASSCSTSSRLQQEVPGLSRLSRTSASVEQIPTSWSDKEALTTLWKTSSTGDEVLESVNHITPSEAHGEELSSVKKSYIRPLVKLPSI